LVSGSSPNDYIIKIIDFDLAQDISKAVPKLNSLEDLKPPELYTYPSRFDMKLYDAWGLGVMFYKLLINQGGNYNIFDNSTAKKYKLIRERLLRSHSLFSISSSNFLTSKPTSNLLKKVLILVKEASKRFTLEEMVDFIKGKSSKK
jgi:hypothetical protein